MFKHIHISTQKKIQRAATSCRSVFDSSAFARQFAFPAFVSQLAGGSVGARVCRAPRL